MQITDRAFHDFEKVRIVACGTSWHAALVGKFMIEKLARIPVEVDYGSEFRYRDPILDSKTLTVCISQSGETADTLAAQREAKLKGSPTLAICNVMGSMIAREAAGTILIHAGPEIGVASTKAFTAQLASLLLLASSLGQTRSTLSPHAARRLMLDFTRIPHKIEMILQADEKGFYEGLARQFFRNTDFLYLGRGVHYPIALEGALRLKEISYIHAEGYPSGEMKHGPNALIDENLPVVILATRDDSDSASLLLYEKSVSNIKEVKARDGIVISVVTEGDRLAREASDHVIELPPAPELMATMLEIVPLQLLAYHIAIRRGCDVDQPRNLAKSVTVE
jgi:glucosamine--fructose-6-phosphate aminotransferase (isomerizing)